MSDLLNVLPDFPVSTYSHIIPSLERNSITTVDLLSLGFADVARKAQIPPSDAKKLCAAVLGALQQDLGLRAENTSGDALKAGDGRAKDRKEDDGVLGGNVTAEDTAWRVITSGDSRLDDVLGGGIPTGYISEFVGESGAGKTQFLLVLALNVQLDVSHGGLGKSALYISTEAALSTSRLAQILESMRVSCPEAFEDPTTAPNLSRVHSVQCPDLESQNHILTYQLPIAIRRFDVGVVIIDSIAANFRTGDTTLQNPDPAVGDIQLSISDPKRRAAILGQRSVDLFRIGRHLQRVAIEQHVAIVVANQVSDWIVNDNGPASSTSVVQNPAAPKYHMGAVGKLSAPESIRPVVAPPVDLRASFLDSVDNISLASSSPMTDSQMQRLATPTPVDFRAAVARPTRALARAVTPKLEAGQTAGARLRIAEQNAASSNLSNQTEPPKRKLASEQHPHPDHPPNQLPLTSLSASPSRIMSLDHQMRWFSGWGEPSGFTSSIHYFGSLKTPALGLTWTNLVSARFVIKKGEFVDGKGKVVVRRRVECVFAAWTGGGRERGVECEIWEGGVRAVQSRRGEREEGS